MPRLPTFKAMSARILENVHTYALHVVQHFRSHHLFKNMSVLTLENGLTSAICATHGLLLRVLSYTIFGFILEKNHISVLYAGAGLVRAAIATFIRHTVGARGSRFMNSVWSVICRLKGSISDVRSLSGSTGTSDATSG